MRVREQRDLAAALHSPADDLLCSRSYVLDGLALRNRRLPNGPVRLFLPNLCRGAALVDAVVPLPEVLVDLGHVSIPCNPAGLPRTLQRAGQHQTELAMRKVIPNLDGALFSARRQRYVGSTGMGAGKAPFCFSVADQPQFQILIARWRHRGGHSFRLLILSPVYTYRTDDTITRKNEIHFYSVAWALLE